MTTYVTEYAITLGIYDDHDVCPTIVFGVVLPYEGCDLWAMCTEMCTQLLLAARKSYGTRIPPHAAFWSGSQREVPYEESIAANSVPPGPEDRDVHVPSQGDLERPAHLALVQEPTDG